MCSKNTNLLRFRPVRVGTFNEIYMKKSPRFAQKRGPINLIYF